MKKERIHPKFSKQVIDYYMENHTVEEVAEKFDITVKRAKSITHLVDNEADKAFKQKLVELYKEGYDTSQLSAMFNINQSTLTYRFRKLGITRHRGPKSKVGIENFFEVIDTETKAYFLGWLMADAGISSYNNELSIKLATSFEDRELIDTFLETIEATYIPVKTTTHGGKRAGNNLYLRYAVSINCKKMFDDLVSHGLTEHKSGNEVFPMLPQNLEHHFVRGYFDGDGLTCIKKNKRSGFIAPIPVLEQIQKRLGTNQKIYHAAASKESKMHYFLGGIRFSKILYQYMYHDATIWLKRKRKRMDIICGNTEITTGTKKPVAS